MYQISDAMIVAKTMNLVDWYCKVRNRFHGLINALQVTKFR